MDMRSVVSLAESLRGANLRGYQAAELEEKLNTLLKSSLYRSLAIQRDHAQLWYRGRVCPVDGFSNLNECIHPKAEHVHDFGRANYPQEPAFYAASNEMTAIGELRGEPGKCVQIIVARPRKGVTVPCHIVGEIEHVLQAGMSLVNSSQLVDYVAQRIFGLPHEERLARLYLDAFLADQFSRRAERPYEYKLTAAYAKLLSPSKGGIMYPSMEVRGGINLALAAELFDDLFEVLATQVVEITAHYGYGVYDFVFKRTSCDFADDGSINWNSTKSVSFVHSIQTGKIVVGDVKGWRVPQ